MIVNYYRLIAGRNIQTSCRMKKIITRPTTVLRISYIFVWVERNIFKCENAVDDINSRLQWTITMIDGVI